MKLSISNIAWDRANDETVYTLLERHGFEELDVTPSPFTPPQGLAIAGMQSLLYGKPELKIFEDETSRQQTFAHLVEMLKHAGHIGASACVFGSPANRRMGEPSVEKWAIAQKFFTDLARQAEEAKTVFCLEPNPASYGTDFLTTSREAFEFVKGINLPGLRVNLDTGTMMMNQENPSELIEEYAEFIGHVHISAPNLGPITPSPIYPETIKALRKVNYQKWISIEMRKPEQGELENVTQALTYLKSITSDTL